MSISRQAIVLIIEDRLPTAKITAAKIEVEVERDGSLMNLAREFAEDDWTVNLHAGGRSITAYAPKALGKVVVEVKSLRRTNGA